MRLAYRGEYEERYRLVADALGGPTDVLEVCFGDLALHDRLQRAGLLTAWVGIDLAPAMLARARRRRMSCDRIPGFAISRYTSLSSLPP